MIRSTWRYRVWHKDPQNPDGPPIEKKRRIEMAGASHTGKSVRDHALRLHEQGAVAMTMPEFIPPDEANQVANPVLKQKQLEASRTPEGKELRAQVPESPDDADIVGTQEEEEVSEVPLTLPKALNDDVDRA